MTHPVWLAMQLHQSQGQVDCRDRLTVSLASADQVSAVDSAEL